MVASEYDPQLIAKRIMPNIASRLVVPLLRPCHHWHQRRALRLISRATGRFVSLPIDGIRLIMDPEHDYIQWQMLSTNQWEKPVSSLFKAVIARCRLFFDVGANIGYFSLLAAANMPRGGRVVAFEPFPRNHVLLNANCILNDCQHVVECERLAVGEKLSDLEMHFSKADWNYGMPSLVDRGQGQSESVTVRCDSLDSFREKNMPEAKVDLVKIDIEGAEYDALTGMQKGLEAGCYQRLLLEVHPQQLGVRGISVVLLLKRLQSQGYSIHRIAEQGLIRWDGIAEKEEKFYCVKCGVDPIIQGY